MHSTIAEPNQLMTSLELALFSTVVSILSALAGIAAAFTVFRKRRQKLDAQARRQAENHLQNARREADAHRQELELEARAKAIEQQSEFEQKSNESHAKLLARSAKLDRREEDIASQELTQRRSQAALEATQQRLAERMQILADNRIELDRVIEAQTEKLTAMSGMDRDEALEHWMNEIESEQENLRGSLLLKHQKEFKQRAQMQAREILLTVIQRQASAVTADATSSTVSVPADDMKGRIIGREGRNIRSFENITGIDVIIDDTPGVVIVSGFDPVRREIARLSLERLIADGRIHPSSIEKTVEQCRNEVEDLILSKGTAAADEVGVEGLDEAVLRQLGCLHFRTSFSQNVLRHSVEVAFIAGMVAELLEMDVSLAKRCGLLHDIGKAADHELEGGHPKIGADLLERHGEKSDVVHAALGHHDDVVIEHPYTMVTAIADSCSASRPGARRESLSRYVKRMQELELIAKRFEGVETAFAVSAGRELRVLVGSQSITDEQAAAICHDIARTMENELTFPGEIKVTVVRESRFVETAK
ncbi:MAG: ribonuclease Y [Planctomycetota bacterium]